jgi:hypothetical protein
MASYQQIMEKLRQAQQFYCVTLDDLASELGVAKSTLSLALQGLGRKWDYLERQRLQRAILKLAREGERA